MTNTLYRWPASAAFGRTVPKTKLYERGNLATGLRDKFVDEIQRITWAFKLAESTINLPGSIVVPEIQVFQIEAKAEDVAPQVLSAIDKAIQFPIVFEVLRTTRGEPQVRMVATHKVLGSGAPKIGAYHSTSWMAADATRQSLPVSTNLPGLYTAILEPLMPVSARPGEGAAELADRLATVRKLEREITALERKLRTEPQLNRKIELRRTLKTRQQELEQQR